MYIECDHIPNKYLDILRYVVNNGKRVNPRGIESYEVSPLVIEAAYSRKRMFGTPGRNENPVFPYIEGVWILEGDDTTDIPAHYIGKTMQYANPCTHRFDGAYGPRLRNFDGVDQLVSVYRRLVQDPNSRRGIVALFDPRRDNNE